MPLHQLRFLPQNVEKVAGRSRDARHVGRGVRVAKGPDDAEVAPDVTRDALLEDVERQSGHDKTHGVVKQHPLCCRGNYSPSAVFARGGRRYDKADAYH